MNQSLPIPFPATGPSPAPGDLDAQAWELFERSLRIARLMTLASRLFGRSNQLSGLNPIEQGSRSGSSSDAGLRTVPLNRITGSLGRSHDFDAGFRPLTTHTRNRWVNIARANLEGRSLPAVELVQVGDQYFVVDGHHRVSVARALGQKAIDAHVVRRG